MYFDRQSLMVEETMPLLLLDQLQALTQLQLRAENLGMLLAHLKQQITRELLVTAPDALLVNERPGHGTILVAEDHPALRAVAQEILEGMGYRVVVTEGRQFDMPMQSKFDGVLLDVPLVNSEQLARVRHAREHSEHIVVSTCLPEGPARQRLRDAGAVGFVSKPLHPRDLGRCLSVLKSADC